MLGGWEGVEGKEGDEAEYYKGSFPTAIKETSAGAAQTIYNIQAD